jgi:hypothetical protein
VILEHGIVEGTSGRIELKIINLQFQLVRRSRRNLSFAASRADFFAALQREA